MNRMYVYYERNERTQLLLTNEPIIQMNII